MKEKGCLLAACFKGLKDLKSANQSSRTYDFSTVQKLKKCKNLQFCCKTRTELKSNKYYTWWDELKNVSHDILYAKLLNMKNLKVLRPEGLLRHPVLNNQNPLPHIFRRSFFPIVAILFRFCPLKIEEKWNRKLK